MSFPLRSLVTELRDPNTVGLPPCPAGRGPALPLVYWGPIAAAGVFTISVIFTLTVSLRASNPADPGSAPAAVALRPETRPPARPKVPAALPIADAKPDAIEPAPIAEASGDPAPVDPVPPIADPVPPRTQPAPAAGRPTPQEIAALMDDLRAAQAQIAKEIAPIGPVAGKVGPDKKCEVCEAPRQPSKPGREFYGTRVEFVRSPAEAAKIAKEEEKLTFILHVSGNFEDDGFT